MCTLVLRDSRGLLAGRSYSCIERAVAEWTLLQRPRLAPPRTYAPPAFITDENGCDLIPLTAAESRRLLNLHVHVTTP